MIVRNIVKIRSSRFRFGIQSRGVHEIASSGFTADTAAMYERSRPAYPDEAVNYIKEIITATTLRSNEQENDNKINVVEIGAGTGIFTRCFFNNNESIDKYNYIATEPSEGFRAKLEKNPPKGVSKVISATGSSIPVDDNSIDGIIVAQAFHWMASDDTINEFHRILKKENNQTPTPGRVSLIWNQMDSSIPWLNELDRGILTRYYDDTSIPRYITGDWEKCFKTDNATKKFSTLKKWECPTNVSKPMTRQQIIDRILSVSVIARRNDIEKKEISDEVEALLRTHPDVRDIKDGELIMQYKTDVVSCLAI